MDSWEAAEQLWIGYEDLLETQGLVTDIATASSTVVISDTIAQTAEQWRDDAPAKGFSPGRAARYAAFGTVDGFASHNWFVAIDAALPKTDTWAVDTLLKVAADSTVYTPSWCLVFLTMMALLEGRGFAGAARDVQRDYFDLLRGNYGLTLPFVALIYGVVPVRFQVLGFAALSLAYTIVLSLWRSSRENVIASSGSKQP